MEKKNFVTLIMSTVGGILFAIGMCMALVPEWDAFNQGVIAGCIGLVVLLVMLVVRRKMEGKPAIKLNGKTLGIIALSLVGSITFGAGFSMTTVFTGMMVQGIIVGIVGIVMLMCLIPVCKGLK